MFYHSGETSTDENISDFPDGGSGRTINFPNKPGCIKKRKLLLPKQSKLKQSVLKRTLQNKLKRGRAVLKSPKKSGNNKLKVLNKKLLASAHRNKKQLLESPKVKYA